MAAHFQLPLNLPHAATIARRITYFLGDEETMRLARGLSLQIEKLLQPYGDSGENPAPGEGDRAVTETARLARLIVREVEREKAGHDRLGQAIRNLFECLELGAEGAEISLRAGENPGSTLRPT